MAYNIIEDSNKTPLPFLCAAYLLVFEPVLQRLGVPIFSSLNQFVFGQSICPHVNQSYSPVITRFHGCLQKKAGPSGAQGNPLPGGYEYQLFDR